MGQNKEELGQLLAFIEILVKQPGNEEFVARLQDIILKYYQNNIGELTHFLSCVNTLVQQPGNDEFVTGLQSIVSKKYPQKVHNSELDTYLKLQRDKCKRKARKYYKDISNASLKTQLIEDHAKMLWYRSVDDVENYFNYVNFQIENIVNYYLSSIDFHSKILANPTDYIHHLVVTPGKYELDIDCNKDFFKTTSSGIVRLPYNKVKTLWSKIWIWAVCTGNEHLVISQANNIASIITIRNSNNHRDSRIPNTISADYWKNLEDDSNYGFILMILKYFRNSII
ncbi:MAG: hypothetical protein J6R25_03230 [Bacteroidales bacterium]|nr:hypothetical protein [Bacteroidales bacterium]